MMKKNIVSIAWTGGQGVISQAPQWLTTNRLSLSVIEVNLARGRGCGFGRSTQKIKRKDTNLR